MPRWFMQARTARGKQILTRTIDYMRALGLYLLEGSSFLNFLPGEHRLDMQQELTTLVEGVKPYNMTLRLVTDGRHGEFITSLLDRLQKSGFIYHPSRQFAVLMLVFRLFPEEVRYLRTQTLKLATRAFQTSIYRAVRHLREDDPRGR